MKLYSINKHNTDLHILEFNPTKEKLHLTLTGNDKRTVLSKIKHLWFQMRGYKLVAKWNWSLFNYRKNGVSDSCGLDHRDKGYNKGDTTRNDVYMEVLWLANKLIVDDIILADIPIKYKGTDWATSIPYTLIIDGEIDIRKAENFNHAKYPNPRTMMGQKSDGTVVTVVTDGRTGSDRGLTAKEQAVIMKELGCVVAVNADGGGSSELVVWNEKTQKYEIINELSGGERAIANALLIYAKKYTMERIEDEKTAESKATLSEIIKDKQNEYLEKYPELKKEKNLIFCFEGLSQAYNGNAKSSQLHPNGRMGAIFAPFVNSELSYTSHSSTLPDIPMGVGKYNDGTPTPTLQTGIYKVYSKLHRGYPAMEVGLGNEGVKVIRNTGESTSSGINIHKRPENDYTSNYATSTGCITVLENTFKNKLELLGVTKNGKFVGSGKYIGKLIIDRSFINSDLQELYKDVYGKYYDKVFNTDKTDGIDNVDNTKQIAELKQEIVELQNKNTELETQYTQLNTKYNELKGKNDSVKNKLNQIIKEI